MIWVLKVEFWEDEISIKLKVGEGGAIKGSLVWFIRKEIKKCWLDLILDVLGLSFLNVGFLGDIKCLDGFSCCFCLNVYMRKKIKILV